MDYKSLYEQSQGEIARLKANDEQALQLAMTQNEMFMDQLAQKDEEIENLKKEVVDERKKTEEEMEDKVEELAVIFRMKGSKVDQLQEEISRLKANDEQALQLAMTQNEMFMDQLAQKDEEIENLKKEVVDERKKVVHMEHREKVREIVIEIELNGPTEFTDYPHLAWIHHLRRELTAAVENHGLPESFIQEVISEKIDRREIIEEINMIIQGREDYNEISETGFYVNEHEDYDIPCDEALLICVEKDLPVSDLIMLIREGGDPNGPLEEEQRPFDDDDMLNPLE